MFQILTNSVLSDLYGTDFGLSSVTGFTKTARFQIYSVGPTGKKYNFSDGSEKAGSFPHLWYFANRFGDSSILYPEVRRFQDSDSYGME